MDSDDDLFRQEMADVTPIKPDNRVQERTPRREPSIREQLRRAAAVDDRKDRNPLTVPEHRRFDRQFYFIMHKQKYRSAGIDAWIDLCRQLR